MLCTSRVTPIPPQHTHVPGMAHMVLNALLIQNKDLYICTFINVDSFPSAVKIIWGINGQCDNYTVLICLRKGVSESEYQIVCFLMESKEKYISFLFIVLVKIVCRVNGGRITMVDCTVYSYRSSISIGLINWYYTYLPS